MCIQSPSSPSCQIPGPLKAISPKRCRVALICVSQTQFTHSVFCIVDEWPAFIQLWPRTYTVMAVRTHHENIFFLLIAVTVSAGFIKVWALRLRRNVSVL